MQEGSAGRAQGEISGGASGEQPISFLENNMMRFSNYQNKVVVCLVISLIIMAGLLISCTAAYQKTPDSLGIENIDTANTEIKIIEIPGQPEVNSNNFPIPLQIINMSDSDIVFPNNYNLKVVTQDEKGEWKEVPNCFQYAGDQIILPAVEGPQLGEVFVILPCMEEIKEVIKFRVIVSGIKQDTTKDTVTAFIDLELGPE